MVQQSLNVAYSDGSSQVLWEDGERVFQPWLATGRQWQPARRAACCPCRRPPVPDKTRSPHRCLSRQRSRCRSSANEKARRHQGRRRKGRGDHAVAAAARLGGLVAVAALGFAFGGTSASDVASVAVVQAYRRVMWTAAALAVAAALMALAWPGNEPPERRRAN